MIRKDILKGEEGEYKVIHLLQNAGHEAIKSKVVETRTNYDISALLIDETTDAELAEFTIEVKNDIYALKSGNVAIEVFNPKSEKLSGLSATGADIWAHILGEEVWFTSPKRLSTFIGIQEPVRIIAKAGDGNATIYLYRKDLILPAIFVRVDNLDKLSITEWIKTLLDGV